MAALRSTRLQLAIITKCNLKCLHPLCFESIELRSHLPAGVLLLLAWYVDVEIDCWFCVCHDQVFVFVVASVSVLGSCGFLLFVFDVRSVEAFCDGVIFANNRQQIDSVVDASSSIAASSCSSSSSSPCSPSFLPKTVFP